MNEIIKNIEAAQLKEVADFNVGDTIKVYAKIKEGNRESIQLSSWLRDLELLSRRSSACEIVTAASGTNSSLHQAYETS